MKLIGKQIDEIIKSMVVINVPYKASDLKYQLGNSGIEISDIQLSRSINRLIKINLLKRIGSGIYIKNPCYFDGSSEFCKDLYRITSEFEEKLYSLISKYDSNNLNEVESKYLLSTIRIKYKLDSIIEDMKNEMHT